jgi:protein ImuB
MELDDAVEELEPLSFLLGRLLDQLCMRLEARALALRAVRVRFELQPSFEKDFQALREDLRTKPGVKQYEKVLTLPVPMRNPKTLLKLLRLQLQEDPPAAPIQKIYMTAEAAASRVAQNGLFVPCGPDPEKLEVTIARLGKLVGEGNVGCAELLDSHRPESFRVARFVVASEQNKRRGKCEPNVKEKSEARVAVTGLRVSRPAQALRVELRNEQPVSVYLQGMRGEVVAASGPWRGSGDWWQEDAWQQDEWDLEIEFSSHSSVGAQHRCAPSRQNVNAIDSPRPASPNKRAGTKPDLSSRQRGLYRIYYDALRQGWFLRGVYD